jgi:hypothetical protein
MSASQFRVEGTQHHIMNAWHDYVTSETLPSRFVKTVNFAHILYLTLKPLRQNIPIQLPVCTLGKRLQPYHLGGLHEVGQRRFQMRL